jgi:prolyl 3-hydroxylase /prolyl 3,4-dihydroxylase
VDFLAKYLNPEYLRPKIMEGLAQRFVDESSLILHSFLKPAVASKLEKGLRDTDARDGLGSDRNGTMPSHETGTSDAWAVKGPPHKWRYCNLKQRGFLESPKGSPEQIIQSLQDELFPSNAFRAWLLGVSRLLPLSKAVEARRFRPGLDYTLATSEEEEARLDVVLGLTPGVIAAQANGKHDESETQCEESGWQAGEWGGWEVRVFLLSL